MALLEINRHPTARELRWSGVLLAVCVALAGGLVHWRLEASAKARMLWTAGAALAATYAAVPPLRRCFFLGWLYAAFPHRVDVCSGADDAGLEMADGQSPADGDGHGEDFEAAAEAARPGLVAELWEFMATNKKWWLTPIIVVLLLVGALLLVSGTAAAPFIYTLF